jgi:hypothetical protein
VSTPCPSSWNRPQHCLHSCGPDLPAALSDGWHFRLSCSLPLEHSVPVDHVTCCSCRAVFTVEEWAWVPVAPHGIRY